MNELSSFYGTLLVVRPPVPAMFNKAGANYKSEYKHLTYSPRRAYDEWLAICDAILASGGDALFEHESCDEPFLDIEALEIDADGAIRPAGASEVVGRVDELMTGRVFTANGPWVSTDGPWLRALLPNMLPHRRAEATYYTELLGRVAEACGYDFTVDHSDHRWEGMADVAVIGDRVLLTYTVEGHYDEGYDAKTLRSSRAGVDDAADFAFVPDDARVHAELVYPHFHGDTVHFCARPARDAAVLFQCPSGLWGDHGTRVAAALGADRVVEISREDAVFHYAANARQVGRSVLVTEGVSARFTSALEKLGLTVHALRLDELFGKAGGGPACATLYLPAHLELPSNAPMRYSVRRHEALARRARLPETLTVHPGYFAEGPRG